MSFLTRVYNILNLTSFSSAQVNSSRKTQISISSKKIGRLFGIYLLFASFITLFFIIWCMMGNLTVNIFGTFEINAILIGIVNFTICTTYALIRHHLFFKTKEPKPINTNIYNRNLPSNLTPAHVRLLVYDGVIDSQSIAATILDLIDRGYLKLDVANRESIFSNDVHIYKTNKSDNELFTYEKYLLDWFFKDGKVSSKTLHQQLNGDDANPSEKFSIFQGLILLSFPLDKYYNKHSNSHQRKFYACCMISFFIYLFIHQIFNNLILFGIVHFITLFGFSNFLLASPTYSLNDYGVEINDCYMDLKRFLKDFSLINEKSSEEIVLWNYYLSYSVALGINGAASEEIASFFGNNIYNMNLGNFDGDNISTDMIPQIIEESKRLYERRK